MRFTAIDVETANADMASICSIGAATFEGERITAEWYSLVNPEVYFDEINISIHGIDESMVAGAPTYASVSPVLSGVLQDALVVTHTHFDRVAIHHASNNSAVPMPVCRWLDSAKVARRTWQEFARSGYGLANVCQRIGYSFQHHNALEDAKAAGQVVLAAMKASGSDLEGLLSLVARPITLGSVARAGNPEGALYGEVIVFTGALEVPRREAADFAASIGCEVAEGVTKETTLLVVGDADLKRLAGHEKSSKHRKAEQLASQGVPIRIIRETDFRQLVTMA